MAVEAARSGRNYRPCMNAGKQSIGDDGEKEISADASCIPHP